MVAFIILHYKNFKDTKICIDSIIENCRSGDYKIVVVDNGGDAESKAFFEAEYSDEIHVIYNQENLGFSAGNNIGCEYAVKNYNPDFLYVVNNDTKLTDKNVLKNIELIYRESNFDILGPKIFDISLQKNLNPCHSQKNEAELRNWQEKLKFCRKWLKLGAIPYVLSCRFYEKLIKKVNYTGFGLSGAALIFSKKYFTRFEKIFPELTKMYCEESFLAYRVQKYNLIMIYDGRTEIEHFGGVSTKKVFRSRKKLYRFKIDNQIKANEQLLRIYKNNSDI